jgi:hypothetical protein
MKILHNHIGYEASGSKHAVVLGKAGDQLLSFRILESETGQEVFAGTPQAAGPVQRWKDWHFWTIDFDGVRAEGTYYIECSSSQGTLRSYPFAIRATLLEQTTVSDLLYYFKSQRCSGSSTRPTITSPSMGTPPAGRSTRTAAGTMPPVTTASTCPLVFLDLFQPQQIPLVAGACSSPTKPCAPGTIATSAAICPACLMKAVRGRLPGPGQDDDGSFYITVSGMDRRRTGRPAFGRVMLGFEPGGMEKGPSKEAQVFPHTAYQNSYRSGGGVAIAALALASTFEVSGDFESADYLRAAREAFAFLEAHNLEMTNDGRENIVDLYCALLAATELYKATRQETYRLAADRRATALMAQLAEGQRPYWRADDTDRPFFHASDGGFPVVSLLNYLDIAGANMKQAVLQTVRAALTFDLDMTAEVNNPFGYSRQFVQNKAGDRRTAFFFPHDTEVSPWWQGENARLGSVATAARRAAKVFSDDRDFQARLQDFATNQINWILGLHPFDMCMLDGSGHNNPLYYSDNGSYQFTNCPGGVCSGITTG